MNTDIERRPFRPPSFLSRNIRRGVKLLLFLKGQYLLHFWGLLLSAELQDIRGKCS
jgi:hypothetical protein